ncbi:MAG: glycosyl hydrolase [Anaerolineae bacterium]
MAQKKSDSRFKGLLEYRCIGPFRGGRVVTVAGDPTNPAVFYFGAVAGGVWKTTDAGMYWECISDGYFNTASVGALAVAESDPNVLYAGTGETTIRIDVSHGDGVYKSTDQGRTWSHMGLADTRHIAKIKIHPENPDLVYVAAFGHAFGPNKQRGVYRSKDGGKNWEQVLFQSDKAGAIDLTMDKHNPRILYAATWEAYRNFWQISSGGPGSAIYQSTDGGDTWTDISANKGLPQGVKGKIGIVASPAKSGRVWALIEHKDGGLYRSDDYGQTWEKVSSKDTLWTRSWYYMHVVADPQDPDTVYIMDYDFWKSSDGGRTFDQITTPHGDNHDLWIDPHNPRRMIEGNDGGACITLNGGESWSSIYNQPTSQYYHVATDNQFPYRVYGTQQDNSSISVPSQSPQGAITWQDCYMAGTGESGHIVVHPDDPNIVFVGAIGSSAGGGAALQRYDHRTGQIRLVNVWPESTTGHGADAQKYRFHWTFPISFSPHNSKVLYTTANVVFRSTNQGSSWEAISPDLTRADPATLQPTGGPINRDSIGAETYATIFAFAESPLEKGLLWAGSDDGRLHISRDNGKSWTNITPKSLPEWMVVSTLEPSPHHAGTAYFAGTRYKLDDYQPYLYKTTDYGKTWKRINNGIHADDFTRVIRADPAREGLLYAGTETGLYVSFDDGANWESLQLNLPVSPVHDMVVKGSDLVVGTHGRAFWILDDVTPLRQFDASTTKGAAYLFQPRDTHRIPPALFEGFFEPADGKNYGVSLGNQVTFVQTKTPENAIERKFYDAGANPPKAVVVTYFLKKQPKDKISLAFLDADGNLIKEFFSKPEEPPDEAAANILYDKPEPTKEEKEALRITAREGFNRFLWNMRYPDSTKLDGEDVSAVYVRGPVVAPGTYQVQLKVGKQVLSQSFMVLPDPRISASQADLDAQRDLLLQIRDKMSETNHAINQIRYLRQQVDEWTKRSEGHAQAEAIKEAGKTLNEKLKAIEDPLIVPGLKSQHHILNYGVRLSAKLESLVPIVSSADFAPTKQAREVFTALSRQIDAQIKALNKAMDSDVKGFADLVSKAGIAPLVLKPKKDA